MKDHSATAPNGSPRGAAALPLALVALLAAPLSPLLAQSAGDPREMTVEELERHIEQQRAELEKVRRNRDITAEKAREVEAALTEQAEKRRAVEEEVDALCREREALEPGSYDECRALLDG